MTNPLLSICIPTHGGRATELADALGSVLAQLTPEIATTIEVCVSDNASADDTAQRIQDLQRRGPDVIRYRRNERDLGGPANLLLSVEMARGRWCWLLSSDDALLPDALAGALALIDRHPEAAGFTLGWRLHDQRLERTEGPELAHPPFNAGGRERELTTPAEIFTECGPLFDYMSIHVFRAALWRGALAGVDERRRSATIFPTTLVLGRIAASHPNWIWSPLLAVGTRSRNQVLMRGGTDPARLRARAFADQRRVWSALIGADRRLQQQIALRWVDLYASPDVLRGDRRDPNTRVAGQLRLLGALVPALSRAPGFWSRTLPLLVVPAPLDRAGRRLRARLQPSNPLPPGRCRTRIRPDLSDLDRAFGSLRISCEAENLGPSALRSTAPYPVHLAHRWFGAESGTLALEGQRTRLDPPLRSGERRRYELPLELPEPGSYVLRISFVQERVAWFDDLVATNGWAAPVTVSSGSTGAIARSSEQRGDGLGPEPGQAPKGARIAEQEP